MRQRRLGIWHGGVVRQHVARLGLGPADHQGGADEDQDRPRRGAGAQVGHDPSHVTGGLVPLTKTHSAWRAAKARPRSRGAGLVQHRRALRRGLAEVDRLDPVLLAGMLTRRTRAGSV